MIDYGKLNVLGVRINAVDYPAAVGQIISAAHRRQPLTVSALAVHGVMTGVLNPTHRYRLNQFDLLVPDGQPVRWALQWLHRARLPDRVYGPNLMRQVCQRAAAEGLSIFLYGGTQETITVLCDRLIRQHPGLQVAGAKPSAFRQMTALERDAAAAEIRASGAQIAFIGLGCPRQEVFAFEMREQLPMPVLAVGAAFNFHAGILPQAPPALQRRGLEWMFRLLQEPRRLWRRYLLLNPLYLMLLGLQTIGWWDTGGNLGQPPREELRYG